MRVCFVTTSFPRWPGDGQGAFIWEAARAIAREGIQVRVVAMHSPGARTYEVMEGVEVIRPRYWWPEKWELLKREGGGLPITWRKYPLSRFQILPFIFVHALTTARYARDCDLIHAHWTLSAAAAVLGKWRHRCRILATVHGSDIFQIARYPGGRWVTRQVLKRCDYVAAVSRALMEAVIAIGVNPQKIRVISNGVNTEVFAPPGDECREHTILYVGSLIERKGVKYLILSLPEIFQNFPDYRLTLIGDGPQLQILRTMVNELGMADRVEFLGFVEHEEVRKRMQRARLVVLPSIEEAQGVVLLESLSCGTPVVASQVGGIPDVISPDVGILVPPATPAALSKAIQLILENPALWANMSLCARERAVLYFDWNVIARQLVALYAQVLSYG